MILPFLASVLAVEQDIIDTSSNVTAVSESKNKKVELIDSMNGWQSLLDRNAQLMLNASTGKLKGYEVTHLVAEALLQDINGTDSVLYINGSSAPDANKLRSISAISFGGTGAVIAYSDTSDTSTEDVSTDTVTFQDEAGQMYEDMILPGGYGYHFVSNILFQGQLDDISSETKTNDKSRVRGFSLGDGDRGDSFDVQVFTDPVFGSFVFNTMSGQSRYVFCFASER